MTLQQRTKHFFVDCLSGSLRKLCVVVVVVRSLALGGRQVCGSLASVLVGR